MATPIIKWAGGKRQLLQAIKETFGDIEIRNNRYYEPFFGGGALFFDLKPRKANLNDINKELMNVYRVVRDNVDELIQELEILKNNHSEEQFYKIRELDREVDFLQLGSIFRAARTIYLNKTCFNGLYRVNSKGYFNTPSGKYINPSLYDELNLRNVSKLLSSKAINLTCKSYEESVKYARKGAIIYFDPPYDYENEDGFVGYSKQGFNQEDLKKLKTVSDKLVDRGCIVLLSNNDTPYVRQLFEGDHRYHIEYVVRQIDSRRSINCNGKNRKNGKEVIIYGRKSFVPASE
jgi:DNA adenine methylase